MFIFFLSVFLLVFVNVYNINAMSNEDPNNLSESEKKEIVERMKDLDINQKNIDSLIKKIENGKEIDSMNSEKVQAIEDKLKVSVDEPIQRYEFPDGSVIERSIKPTNQISAQSCTSQSCTYSDYEIKQESINIVASFNANFTVHANGYSEIHSVGNAFVNVHGAYRELESQDLGIVYNTETSTLPARAQLMFTATTKEVATDTHYLKLNIQNGYFTIDATFPN